MEQMYPLQYTERPVHLKSIDKIVLTNINPRKLENCRERQLSRYLKIELFKPVSSL